MSNLELYVMVAAVVFVLVVVYYAAKEVPTDEVTIIDVNGNVSVVDGTPSCTVNTLYEVNVGHQRLCSVNTIQEANDVVKAVKKVTTKSAVITERPQLVLVDKDKKSHALNLSLPNYTAQRCIT